MMMMSSAEGDSSRTWAWLFPLTYLLHIAEEYWLGFPAWFSAWTGVSLSADRFVAINAVAWLGMCVGVALFHALGRPLGVIPVALATVTVVNGTAHLATSILTRSYSPGVASGVLLWVPLGLMVIRWGRRSLPPLMVASGVALGLFLHALVTVSAIRGR